MLRSSSLPDGESEPLAAQVARLRAENEALRTSIVDESTKLPPDWRLTQAESLIFRALLKNDPVPKRMLAALMYGREGSAKDLKNLDVFISRIRSKTVHAKVTIETIFGFGYRLSNRAEWVEALTLGNTERN